VSLAHHVLLDDRSVVSAPCLYTIRIKGHLGATALSAFPSMVAAVYGGETVLTGPIDDRSALFGVLGQIEALGLELLEVRRIHATPTSPAHTEPGLFDGRD
jgi:hypothetical protein